MNRYRSQPKPGYTIFVAACIFASISIYSGVQFAMLKNAQVRLGREIRKTDERIKDYQGDIQMVGVRMDKMMDRFELREKLQRQNTLLVPNTHRDIEEILPTPDIPGSSVALIQP